MGTSKVLMNIAVLFLVVSASFAGGRGHSKFVNNMEEEIMNNPEEISGGAETEMNTIHERLLKVNTKDYGNNKPAPALVRPPFKLIPN